jgi:membrane associated rhomboid family serine protease
MRKGGTAIEPLGGQGRINLVGTLKDLLRPLLSDFRPLLYTYLLVVVPSTVVLLYSSINPSLEVTLSESRLTPWGIVTSIFVHASIAHFADNVLSLILFIILFVAINEYYPRRLKHRRAIFFAWNVFFSAISANVAYILFSSDVSIGASGVVFGAEGVTLGFALANIVPSRLTWSALTAHLMSENNRKKITRNLAVFTVFFGLFLLAPAEFLVYGPGFNVFVHFVGFYVGFASALAYGLFFARAT